MGLDARLSQKMFALWIWNVDTSASLEARGATGGLRHAA